MIIVCPNCNKKFNIDENLIPDKGRLLKCSNCDYVWNYKLVSGGESQPNKDDSKKEIIINENDIDQSIKKQDVIETKEELINQDEYDKEDKSLKKNEIKSKAKKKTEQNILSLLIVFLISFTAIIFLIDTFKLYIANFFPSIITILENLYATLHDLILFVKDLFSK